MTKKSVEPTKMDEPWHYNAILAGKECEPKLPQTYVPGLVGIKEA
jgi:hypothetical protein